MPDQATRMALDKISADLFTLIKGNEGGELERGSLLITYQLSQLFEANMRYVEQLAAELEENKRNDEVRNKQCELHMKGESRRSNERRGAWKVIMWVAGALQVLILTAGSAFFIDYRDGRREQAATEAKVETLLNNPRTNLIYPDTE